MLQKLHTTRLGVVDTISWSNCINGNSLEDDGEIIVLMKENSADHNCNLMVLDRCEAFWFRPL